MANSFHFSSWPYDPKSILTVHWVSSPFLSADRKAYYCKVYFSDDGHPLPEPLAIQWGAVPQLWIGRRFRAGLPLDEDAPCFTHIMINASGITGQYTLSARNALYRRTYELDIQAIYEESCLHFNYENREYIVPCVELVRALFMPSSGFANQLLSSEGLDGLLVMSSWKCEKKELYFDLSPLGKKTVSPALVPFFALLYGVLPMRQAWQVASNFFTSPGTGSLIIPAVSGLSLDCLCKTSTTQTFITHIEKVNMDSPFTGITYGPPVLEHPGRSGKPRVTNAPDIPDNISIGHAEASAKRGEVAAVNTDSAFFNIQNAPQIKRASSEAGEKVPLRKRPVLGEKTDFSLNDQVGIGELPSADLQPSPRSEAPIQLSSLTWDKDFSFFCEALKLLQNVYHVSPNLSYGTLSSEKPIPGWPTVAGGNMPVSKSYPLESTG